MTLAILQFPTSTPTVRDLMDRALDPHILVGMPHLNAGGLSETWLMKELGHRHWLMLAREMGMEGADFRTSDGGAAYAAICATSLRNGSLNVVSANDVLSIQSSLSAVSRTQMSSRHRLRVGAVEIADVELVSTFVHRLTAGDNHSVARVAVSDLDAVAVADNWLARSAAAMRSTLRSQGKADLGTHVATSMFRASPSQEFNGAGLFYFAEFQALMDRAHEDYFAAGSGIPVTGRDVYFFGNIRLNELVKVESYLDMREPVTSGYRVYREDGKTIAIGRRFGGSR